MYPAVPISPTEVTERADKTVRVCSPNKRAVDRIPIFTSSVLSLNPVLRCRTGHGITGELARSGNTNKNVSAIVGVSDNEKDKTIARFYTPLDRQRRKPQLNRQTVPLALGRSCARF